MELELSKKQMDKITYESMLLRMTPQQLYIIAPHLFEEGITSANSKVDAIEPIDTSMEQLKALEKELSVLHNTGDDNNDYYYGY